MVAGCEAAACVAGCEAAACVAGCEAAASKILIFSPRSLPAN